MRRGRVISMINRETLVDVGSLGDRPVERADVVMRLRARDGGVRLVARDASSGRFAGLSVVRRAATLARPRSPPTGAGSPC